MNAKPSPTPTTLAEEVEAAWSDLSGLGAQIRSRLTWLATNPDPGGPAETELIELFTQRDRAAHRIGRLAVRWEAAGGEVAFYEPGLVEEVTPSAEPQAQAPEAPETPAILAAAPPPEPPSTPAPPASAAALRDLCARGLGGAASPSAEPKRPQAPERVLPPLAPLTTPEGVATELENVRRLVAGLDAWLDLPAPAPQRALEHVAARARALQSETKRGLHHDAAAEVTALFSTLTEWTRERKTPFAHGLARAHTPRRPTWRADAEALLAELREISLGKSPAKPLDALCDALTALADLPSHDQPKALERAVDAVLRRGVPQSDPDLIDAMLPWIEVLGRIKNFKTLRAKVKAAVLEEDAEVEEADQAAAIPEDWPLRALVQGKRIAILGGDRRAQAEGRLKATFGFAEVSWEHGLEPRKVQTLCERVHNGKIDLVLTLARFCNHSASNALVDACKAADVPFANVERGYGVVAVRRALERYLGASDDVAVRLAIPPEVC